MADTQAVIQYTKIMRQEMEEDDPSTYYGGNARRRIALLGQAGSLRGNVSLP
jgi:hypothetical protein